MTVTIKDVARDTNLAISTISKYMNGGNVRPENKKVIEESIMRLGYSPNHLARGLRTSRSYTYGFLIPSLVGGNSGRLVSSLEQAARKRNCFLTICCHQGSAGLAREYVEFLAEKGVDGIIVSPVKTKENYLQAAREAGIPLVILEDIYEETEGLDVIQVDCATSSYEIVESLIKKGHRKIAILKGIEGMTTAKERLNGYLRVMEDYGIPVEKSYLIEGDYDYSSGYAGVKALWALKDRPTAVFVTNYHMSIGALVAVKHLNIRVPEELSIVSFDDMDLSALADFRITTVRQPMDEVMDEACSLLEKRIQGDYGNFPEKKRIKAKVIYRDFQKDA